MHTDHTSGLNPSWNNGIIYCSWTTRALLLQKFKVNPELVIGLDEDETHQIPLDSGLYHNHSTTHVTTAAITKTGHNKTTLISSLNSLNGSGNGGDSGGNGKVMMQLTLIDANHCPGSCMFLLDGYFGRILCTGDFRYDPVIMQHAAFKRIAMNSCSESDSNGGGDFGIDDLYMDDTFLDPQYDFPPRNVAGKQIVDIVKSFSDETVFLVGSDTLGREELLIAIGMALKSLVVVNSERLEMLQTLRKSIPIPDIFTDDPNEGRVIVLPKKEVNYRTVREYRKNRGPTIGICPSGWSVGAVAKSKKEQRSHTDNWIHRVAYSLHSSFPELVEFVKFLKPKNLYSTSNHDNLTLRHYLGQYCRGGGDGDGDGGQTEREIHVPRSVRMCMESTGRNVTLYPSIHTPNSGDGRRSSNRKVMMKRSVPKKRKGRKGIFIRHTIDLLGESSCNNNNRDTLHVSSSDEDGEEYADDYGSDVEEIEDYQLQCLIDEVDNEPKSPRESPDSLHALIDQLQILTESPPHIPTQHPANQSINLIIDDNSQQMNDESLLFEHASSTSSQALVYTTPSRMKPKVLSYATPSSKSSEKRKRDSTEKETEETSSTKKKRTCSATISSPCIVPIIDLSDDEDDEEDDDEKSLFSVDDDEIDEDIEITTSLSQHQSNSTKHHSLHDTLTNTCEQYVLID